MGWPINFTLHYDNQKGDQTYHEEHIENKFKQGESIFDVDQGVEWDSFMEDMMKYSQEFPNMYFQLETRDPACEKERYHFKNGKSIKMFQIWVTEEELDQVVLQV